MTDVSVPKPAIVLVVAIADNGVIGRDNALIWRQRTDLRRFKALTLGKPQVMGRKTYQSIGRPLPGREIVVVTRDEAFTRDLPAGVHAAFSFDEALVLAAERARAMGTDEVMIQGGADIYRQALPIADRVHLTEIHASPVGDVIFPGWGPDLWARAGFRQVAREDRPAGEVDEFPFSFVDLERIAASASADIEDRTQK